LILASEGAAFAAPRISGRVVDYNGNPIAFADLDFYDATSGAKVDPTPPDAPPQTDKTDLAGRYTLLVIAGAYDVRFQPPAARTDLATVLLRDVVMDVDRVFDITLPLGYPLSGFVRGPSGEPLANVDLDVTDESTGERVPTPGDQSGGSGAYRVVVPPGTYSVAFDPPSSLRLAAWQETGVVISGATALDVQLAPGFVVSGVVRDAGGAPVAGADLDVDDVATGRRLWIADDTTAPDGRYAIIVPAGEFEVIVDPPAAAEMYSAIVRGVAVSADVALADVSLDRGVRVAAQVIGPDGFPFAGAKVLANEASSSLRYPTPTAIADAAGALVFRVPASGYELVVAPPIGSAADSLRAGLFFFANDTTLTLSYVESELLAVTVNLTVEGAPAGGSVAVWPSPRSGNPVATAVADTSGAARVTIPPGLYDLLVVPSEALEPDSIFSAQVALGSDTTLTYSFTPVAPPPPPPGGDLAVGAPRPNPFTISARLAIDAPERGAVRVAIYDLSGRIVLEANVAVDSEGRGEFVWDGNDASGSPAPAGVYALSAEQAGRRATAKLVRMR